MIDEKNLDRARAWAETALRAIGFVTLEPGTNGGEILDVCARLVVAACRSKAEADADLLDTAALVAAAIEPCVKVQLLGLLGEGAELLRAHAGDVPDIP